MKTLFEVANHSIRIIICSFLFIMISCGSSSSGNSYAYKTTTVSYYADKFDGKKTASGEVYRHSKHTASNTTLGFGTRVEIININNNKSVIVTVNDRGPLKASRKFDLSQSAFKKIANLNEGIVKVKYRILR